MAGMRERFATVHQRHEDRTFQKKNNDMLRNANRPQVAQYTVQTRPHIPARTEA